MNVQITMIIQINFLFIQPSFIILIFSAAFAPGQMRPPGGVSFADQMHRHTSAANFSRQKHENGRQIVHHQQHKSAETVNGFGKSRQMNTEFGDAANGIEGVQLNNGGRGHNSGAHLQQQQLCGCCPYGFHIDLGFVKFAEDVAAGKEQIQNWSSPEKKRTRRLLNSPCSSDRTMLDVSQTSEHGANNNHNHNNNNGIVSPPLNESSLSKLGEEEDELPELLHAFPDPNQMFPSVRAHHQPQQRHTAQNGRQGEHFNGMPTSILKNNGGISTHWNGGGAPSVVVEGIGRPTLTLEQRRHLQKSARQIYGDPEQQQQHQSRFYQQQQAPGNGRLAMPSSSSSAPTPPMGRRRFSFSVASSTAPLVDSQQNMPMPSLRLGSIGSPLRTSTPRIVTEEVQSHFAPQQRPFSAYHPSSMAIGTPSQRKQWTEMTNGSGASSAPTSPEPKSYHTAIAQSLAQLRKTSSSVRPNGTFSAIPGTQSSLLSSLSAPARNVFSSVTNVACAPTLAHFRHPITTRPRPFLELGGGGQRRRMLSPEPNQKMAALEPPAGCALLRKSNLQSRAFFHAANSGPGCDGPSTRLAARVGAGGVGRVPYRSRQCVTPTPSPASWDLGDFASVRRHRMDSSVIGGTLVSSSSVPSASFVASSTQLVRSLSPSPPVLPPSTLCAHYQMDTSGTSVAHSPLSSHACAIIEPQQKMPPFSTKTPAYNNTRNIGTQTLFSPSKREIAIGTDRVAGPFVSIGVDTRGLFPEPKSAPPPPPPKPSGPKLDEELQRRRDSQLRRAKVGTLSAEFQYCLGHEPEHKPGEQPQFVGTSTEEQRKKSAEKHRSVDAFCPSGEIFSHSVSTSTTDLQRGGRESIARGEEKAKKRMEEANVQTEERTEEKSEKGTGTDPTGTRMVEVQTEEVEEWAKKRKEAKHEATAKGQNVAQVGTQTDESAEWMEAEIERRLAEAAAERREKRKRNSVERSTETEEKEAPDQFIMITCNKCEQRSSVAGDELFEKIVVPLEDNAYNEAGEETPEQRHQQQTERPSQLGEWDGMEERNGEEEKRRDEGEEEGLMMTSFVVEGSLRGEMETILEELEEELTAQEHGKEGKTEGEQGQSGEGEKWEEENEQREKKEQGKAEEEVEEGYEQREKKEQGKAEEEVEEGDQRKKMEKRTEEREEKQQAEQHQQQQQQPSQNVSPLSSDEGLVLADGEEEELTFVLDRSEETLELDRMSIETDAQTVICAEGTDRRPDSSVSFESIPDEKANAALVASRTEALRKLLTEPQRFAQPFQRDADSNRSYRAEKGRSNDLEYIIQRHKSDTLREAEPTTPCPSYAGGGGKKALKEAITLKKTTPHNASSSSSSCAQTQCGSTSSSSNNISSHIPEPVPARIPRPKFAKYSPNAEQAETADEQAEVSDRLTPLRSEMRALASSLWGSSPASVSPCSSASGSPRIGRALILRPQKEQDDDDDEEDDEEGKRGKGNAQEGDGKQLVGTTTQSALVVLEDGSSTSSEGARTYEMSDEERAEFELSAPLRDALETINGHLTGGANANTKEEQAETEWAYKYCQHEWMKLTIKKSANADLVEQFIDALEAFSTRLMDKVVNMTDQNGNTALHYALCNENFDVVSVLLDSKVCRVDEMNKAGYSALMLGALCELRNETECAIVQRLFHMGNVNAKALKHSQTALMLAASHGRVETTSLLLSCGADVNIQDVDGSTALMCAAEHGQREIVKLLLKRPNIDASLTDCDNQTALSIAVENQHRDIGVLIYAHLNFSRLDSNDQSGVSI